MRASPAFLAAQKLFKADELWQKGPDEAGEVGQVLEVTKYSLPSLARDILQFYCRLLRNGFITGQKMQLRTV